MAGLVLGLTSLVRSTALLFPLSSLNSYYYIVITLLGPLAFALYITRFQIQPEERMLQRLFGEAYTHYTRRVRRWL